MSFNGNNYLCKDDNNEISNLIKVYYSKEEEIHEEFENLITNMNVSMTVQNDQYYGLFKDDYSDLPPYLKYIASCVPTRQSSRNEVQILIVKKYKDIAICYVIAPFYRPIIVFRKLVEKFDKLIIGKSYFGYVHKMYVPPSKELTIVFTDLFAILYSKWYFDLTEEQFEGGIVHNGYFMIKRILFEVNPVEILNFDGFNVCYTDFGAIVIPLSYLNFDDLTEKVHISGSLMFCLRGLSMNHYACWQLLNNFTVFKNKRMHAKCKNGIYQKVPWDKKPTRTTIKTYGGDYIMIPYTSMAPKFVDKPKEIFPVFNHKRFQLLECFVESSTFVTFHQVKQRRR